MADLSHKQINIINDLLVDHGVRYEELKLDLLDHLCCMVEDKMDSGMDFGQSVTLSTQEFGLQSLQNIEEATLYLITLKLRKMKKTTGIIGIISSVMVLAGVLFKINHLPGAGILLVSGLTLVSVLALPMFAYLEMIKQNTNIQKTTSFSGIISGALISIGTLFKIMHWPGANILLTVGLIMMVCVFIPLFTIKNYKTTEYKLLAVAKSLLILAGIAIIWGLVPTGGDHSMLEKSHQRHHQKEISSN